MIKTFLILAVLAAAMPSAATTDKELQRFLGERDYQGAVLAAEERQAADPDDILAAYVLGNALIHLGRNEEALPHLEHALERDGMKSWVGAWSANSIGKAHAIAGRPDQARTMLTQARDSYLTRNCSQDSDGMLKLCGLHELYAEWPVTETEHLVCRFSKALGDLDRQEFAADHEGAYDELVAFFGEQPAIPITYLVWSSQVEADVAGVGDLGYARPEVHVIHCLPDQTLAHELCHVVLARALRPTAVTDLINEGAAVLFDGTGRDRLAVARYLLAKEGSPEISIAAAWVDLGTLPGNASYAVAGAFADALFRWGGEDKFKELLRVQTPQRAREIYGPDLDAFVARFEESLRG